MCDASAAVKLLIAEAGSDVVRTLWDDGALTLVAPAIIVPEVAAAIEAAARDGRLPATDLPVLRQTWLDIVEQFDVVSVDERLAVDAAEQAQRLPIRGMDAIYLALLARLATTALVGLLTFDTRQREAALGEIPLLPATVD